MAAAWQLLPRWVLAAVLQRSTPVVPSLKMSFALLPDPVWATAQVLLGLVTSRQK